jgi:hypothetical protein
MSNRNFNKQTTNARQGLADGGPAGTGKGAAPFKGPRSGKPSLADTIRKATPPNSRKELKPFSKFQEPMPKLGRPSDGGQNAGTGKGALLNIENRKDVPRKPMPKRPRPKGLTPEQIKKLKEQMKKRKIKSSSPPKRDKRLGLK